MLANAPDQSPHISPHTSHQARCSPVMSSLTILILCAQRALPRLRAMRSAIQALYIV
jgi:hypothetical protein